MSGWLPTVSMPTMSMPTMPAMPNIPGLRKHQEDGTIPEEDALAAGAAAEAAIAEEATGGDDEDKSRYQAARYVGAKTVDRDGGKQACSRRMGFPGYKLYYYHYRSIYHLCNLV